MTIATPNRDRQLTYAMRWLFVGVVVFGSIVVVLNNKTVTLHRLVAQKEKIVDQLKLQNAQLKNSFYAVLDTRTLVATAEKMGYVKDSAPAYLTFRSDGTAEQDSLSSASLKP